MLELFFSIFPTREYKRGKLAFLTVAFALFVFFLTLFIKKTTGGIIEIDPIDFEFNIAIYLFWIRIVCLVYFFSTLLIMSIRWGLRNNWSLKNYLIVWHLRYQLNRAKFSDQGNNDNIQVLILPKILLEFDTKERLTGKVKIQNSIEFDKQLESIRLSSALKGYKVESSFVSDDQHWYIFEFYSLNMENQKVFETVDDFLKDSLTDVDQYKLKFDSRYTAEIDNTLVIGSKGSGKSYAQISLILQMINKKDQYDLYFLDPKRADFLAVGNLIDSEKTEHETTKMIEVVQKVHKKMEERQALIEKKLKTRLVSDYKDFKLTPIVLFIDEYPEFKDKVYQHFEKKKDADKIIDLINSIARLGRQSGVRLFLTMQRVDATILPGSIKNNMGLIIVLGNAQNMTYITALDRAENVPNYQFSVGQGVYRDSSMTSPKLIFFPYLKFLDTLNKELDELEDDDKKIELLSSVFKRRPKTTAL